MDDKPEETKQEAPKEEPKAEEKKDAPSTKKKSFFARLFKKRVKKETKPAEKDAPQEAPKEEPPMDDKPEEKKDVPVTKKKSFFARLFKKKPSSPEPEKKDVPEQKPLEKKTEKTVEKPKGKKEPSKKQPFFARLFKKPAKPKKEKTTEPAKGTKKKKKRLSLLDRKKKKKKKRERRTYLQQRRLLADLTMKAGFDVNPEKLRKVVFYTSFGLVALFTFLSLLVAAASGKSAGKLLLFYFGVWTAVFAFVYLFIWMVIYFFLDIRIYNRTQELEDVLPDFLQLASANISAGMPIDRALWFAVRPNFGVLAKEIEEVAKSTLAGEELNESLLRFTDKYDSVTLKRSINILLEGLAAGGKIAELLNKIALNIQETKIQRKEMSANVATYAIFITFASIIMAPLLFALATELLTIIVKITGNLDLGASSSSFITLNIDTSMEMVKDFRAFCILMLTISAVMSASIVSVIRRGRVKEGLRNLPIFAVVSLLLYFFASKALHAMLGGLI